MGTAVHTVVRFALLAGLVVAPLGCDSSGVGTTYPVTGAITLNGKALTGATMTVVLKPDAGRGNTTTFEPAGTVDENGQYTVRTNGKEGAPPGWYKVVVTGFTGQPKHSATLHDKRPVVKSVVPETYGTAARTKLAIEVVASPAPAAYDLKMTKP